MDQVQSLDKVQALDKEIKRLKNKLKYMEAQLFPTVKSTNGPGGE